MNLTEKIADILVKELIPYQQLISAPFRISLPNRTTISITEREICLDHDFLGEEHFSLSVFADDNILVTTRPGFKGMYATEILQDLTELIEKHIPNLDSKMVRAKLISAKIQSLQNELTEITE